MGHYASEMDPEYGRGTGPPKGYTAKLIVGIGTTLWSCDICGALCTREKTELHSDWHWLHANGE